MSLNSRLESNKEEEESQHNLVWIPKNKSGCLWSEFGRNLGETLPIERELEPSWLCSRLTTERKFFIDNLLVRIHFIIVMIRWTGLAPWEIEFPFQGSLISTFPPDDTLLLSTFRG